MTDLRVIRVALYARVSTSNHGQDVTLQIRELAKSPTTKLFPQVPPLRCRSHPDSYLLRPFQKHVGFRPQDYRTFSASKRTALIFQKHVFHIEASFVSGVTVRAIRVHTMMIRHRVSHHVPMPEDGSYSGNQSEET
jgi:hypothetical protein